jgi:ABC transporter substrate binding protein (PQQ-dependent alcohol dehydrogenase system)
MTRRLVRLALLLLPLILPAAARAEVQTIGIGYLGETRTPTPPLGPLDEVATREGIEGARLGIADNDTTGRFLGQAFRLSEAMLPAGGDPRPALGAFAAAGIRFVVADLDADLLSAAAAAPEAGHLVLLNARATDDRLRAADCRRNLLHTIPSRAMLADGLAQYLAWKRWNRWFLVVGPTPADQRLAEAYRTAAKRFGASIVAEKPWTFRFGSGRADTGHVTLQSEIPSFTQGADYDVLVVADEADAFGAYLVGRTWRARPVAGTQGLVATGWSAVNEEWGATQLQERFRKQAGRWMTPVDYAAWLAVRAVGEGATRTHSAEPATIEAYLRGPDFLLGGFKGRGLSFRPWDGQMRQPILIAGPRLLVSVSPQPGFLHQLSELDTLGVDRGESKCRL